MTIRSFAAVSLISLFGAAACISYPPQSTAQSDEKNTERVENCIPQTALDAYVQLRWERRVDQWDHIDAPKNAIVFLGSSIVEEGEWDALFPETSVVNRGIGADTTQGVLNRLDQVIKLEPRKVFIYIGGNDFSRLNDTPEAALERLGLIVEQLRDTDPNLELYVHTLFPREVRHADKIREFNALVEKLNAEPQVTVIDVFPWFARSDGSIEPSIANDGIHLGGEAYQVWADNIRVFLAK